MLIVWGIQMMSRLKIILGLATSWSKLLCWLRDSSTAWRWDLCFFIVLSWRRSGCKHQLLLGFSLGQSVLVKRIVGKFCLLMNLEITVLSVMGGVNLVCVCGAEWYSCCFISIGAHNEMEKFLIWKVHSYNIFSTELYIGNRELE